MTSNRLSILKPGRPREPLQDLSQLLPTNDDEETTTTDNHKRRVSFACVNKVKEFEIGAECTTLHQTPAYDERFSISSDSYQSSISEHTHNKSTFITFGDASGILNRSKINDENVDVVEVGLHNVTKGGPSPGKTSGCDSSMDITSVIVRNEHEYTDYESNSETYYPLNLTKSRQSIQSVHKSDDSDDNDASSMETTEALPCIMTETIVTDFDSFSQSMDVSVEEIGVDEEKVCRLSMNPALRQEKIFHLRQSTTFVSEKDVQFTIDAFGDIKDPHIQENIFVKKQVVALPEVESSAMEEDTSLNVRNRIVDKENDIPLSQNTDFDDKNDSHVEETEVVGREMDISISESFTPAKDVEKTEIVESEMDISFSKSVALPKDSYYSITEVTEKGMQPSISVIENQEKEVPSEGIILEEKNIETFESVVINEQPDLHGVKNVEDEETVLPEKTLLVEIENNTPLVESILEDEKHSFVECIITDENKQLQSVESSDIEENEQSQPVLNLVIDKKEQLQPVQNPGTVADQSQPVKNPVAVEELSQPVQNLVSDEKEQCQPVQSLVTNEKEQLQPIQHPVENEKTQLQPVQNITNEQLLQPVQSLVTNEKEQFQPVQSPVANEKIRPQSIQSPVIKQKEQLQPVHSPVVIEKQLSSPIQSPVIKQKQLQPVQSPVINEKQILQPVQSPVIKHKERLQPVQSPVVKQKEQLEHAENPITEESNFHDEILSVELQNCQLIENSQMEEEENSHLNESKMEEEISTEDTVATEEKNSPSPKPIISEEKTISDTLPTENTTSDEGISLDGETSFVEMENLHPTENLDKNDGIDFQPSEKCSAMIILSRPPKRKSDSFVPEVPPPEPSPKRPNIEANSKISQKNDSIRQQIENILQSGEIPCWTVVSMNSTEWKFGALWNRLHLVITLPENDTQCISKLRFIKKDSKIGDEILKVAIAPIIRKYRKKMDELCGKVEDVAFFMKMTIPSIKFAKNFAEDFSEIIEFENILLDNGFASFLVANYKSHLLAKIQVDMRNIEDFSDSSLEIKQNIGSLDETLVRKIFFEARGDFDFFSKFVKNLNRSLNS